MDLSSFPALLREALLRREKLLDRLRMEGTDAYRLFHGIAEGVPGLTVDRYGSLVLAQTFRDPLSPEEVKLIEETLGQSLSHPFHFVYNHRGNSRARKYDEWHQPAPEALKEIECHEAGARFWIRARHPGLDPWLFLDLRAGRRVLRRYAEGRSVLNLFSYTGGAGVAASRAGASEVWNVDFASSNQEVGRRNATLNGIPEKKFRILQEDCLPVMRQLAGLPAGGRKSKCPRFTKLEPRQFDIVFLDPPAWSKGPFGAVDVVGDYPSLFKPAVLTARLGGGKVIATHHVASVPLASWLETLKRCAEKAGRPLKSLQAIVPDEDFPSFDGNSPLKIAVCEV